MGPSKGIESRGCTLKPSSVLMTSRLAESLGRAAQSGLERLTRRPVIMFGSLTVKRSLGKSTQRRSLGSKRSWTPPAYAWGGVEVRDASTGKGWDHGYVGA